MQRNILLAIDFSEASTSAFNWTITDLYKKGDSLHLLHISKCLSPPTVILHSLPGTTYSVPDPKPISEEGQAQVVRQALRSRFGSLLDSKQIPYNLHIYLDVDSATASAIGGTICKVADTVDAHVVVVASHEKSGLDMFLHGSVSDYCASNCLRPLAVVKDASGEQASTPPTEGPGILKQLISMVS